MDNKFCIITYVTGDDYQEFIPVYVYSIMKSYPNYSVIIYCGEKLKENINNSLNILAEQFKFKIVENYLPVNPTNITKRFSSTLKRWLTYSDDFIDYDYIYIGDIDIFVNYESPEMLEQHIVHCKTINLDYSNIMRRSGLNKVTGLHFVKRKPYFKKMLPVIIKYRELLHNNKLNFDSDETLLYTMIKEAKLGLCPRATGKDTGDPRQPTFRPEHGVHLAVFRDLFVKKHRLESEEFKQQMKAMKESIDDPIFKEIEANFDSRMIKRIFRRVHQFKVD